MKNLKSFTGLDDKGQNIVEFALVVSLLLAILFGIAEFGRAWFYSNHLTNAVRATARYAAVLNPFNTDQVENYLTQEIDNTAGPGGPLHADDIDTDNTFVKVFHSYTSTTPVTDANVKQGDVIKVQVAYRFQFLVSAYLLPIEHSREMVRTATMQYEEENK